MFVTGCSCSVGFKCRLLSARPTNRFHFLPFPSHCFIFSPPRHAAKLKLQYNVSSCFIDKSKKNNFINLKYLQIIYDNEMAPGSIILEHNKQHSLTRWVLWYMRNFVSPFLSNVILVHMETRHTGI